MNDPVAEIRHLLGRYQEAMRARDLVTLSELHWQDPRFTHVGPSGIDVGWGAYAQRLNDEFGASSDADFRLSDVRVEVFHGKFVSALARWERQGSPRPAASRRVTGQASFLLSKMGSSWKIVADHHAPARGRSG
jgi:ketosteroid isomerase-like protein